MKNILVVDDEQDLCEILQFNLVAEGYDVAVAHSGEEALAHIRQSMTETDAGFDLLILDVMMPGMSGFELAARLRAGADGMEAVAHIPIIFLTARDTEDDTLEGFRLGADDYVTKPFSVREVMARVKAILARTARETPAPSASYEGLVMDRSRATVTVDGAAVAFTHTEFDLLWHLLTHRDMVFTRQQLLADVWPSNVIVSERTVDVNLARVRKKIGRYAACIVARSGYGYSFVPLPLTPNTITHEKDF